MKYILLLFLIMGCCTPEAPVATLELSDITSFELKGFDCNCNGTIDYWQHYKDGKKFGSRQYESKGEPTECE